MLIGFRALQGLGAALISPAALSIISTTFAEGAERAKALAVWAAIAIGGAAVGLDSRRRARAVRSRGPGSSSSTCRSGSSRSCSRSGWSPSRATSMRTASFDIAGAVTVTGGLMALVYAIVKAETDGWTSSTTIGFFVLSAVLLASFVVIESRSKAPLVRLSIFRIRSLHDGQHRDVPRRCRGCSRCSSSTRSTSSGCSATSRSRPGSRSCRSRRASWSRPGSRRASRRGSASGPSRRSGWSLTAPGCSLLTQLPGRRRVRRRTCCRRCSSRRSAWARSSCR